MKTSTVKVTCLILFALAIFASCVRYYPSREEINKPFGDDPAVQRVGPEAFFQYDRDQRKRLEKLISDRIESADGAWDGRYKIGASDSLQIEVKNFEEVSKDYKVHVDGTINLPFVGKIKVSNLTEEELAAKVANAVQDYVLEPQVHVEVVDYSAYKIWVVGGSFSGSSHRPRGFSGDPRFATVSRSYPLKRPNYSLVELLVEIGEAERLASGGSIYIFPTGALHSGEGLDKEKILAHRRITLEDVNPLCSLPGNPPEREGCPPHSDPEDDLLRPDKYHPNARIMIDLEQLFGGISQPPLYVPLRPGDAIYIPPSALIQVFGEVNRRGTFHVMQSFGGGGTTGSGGNIKPTLMSLLAEAHGLSYSADIHNIEIYRELEFGKKVVMAVDFEQLTLRGAQDFRLRDGDIIWVPSQSGRFIEEHSINAINEALGAGNRVYTTATD